jgi:hypothetical protein
MENERLAGFPQFAEATKFSRWILVTSDKRVSFETTNPRQSSQINPREIFEFSSLSFQF